MVANSMKTSAFILLSLCLIAVCNSQNENDFLQIEISEVKKWAFSFGKHLFDTASKATCVRQIERQFKQSYRDERVEVIEEDAGKILTQFISDIERMFDTKRSHVARIAQTAEELAANYTYDPNLFFPFYNAKKLYDSSHGETKVEMIKKHEPNYEEMDEDEKEKEQAKWLDITLTKNSGYRGVAVNVRESAFHIPVNVFNEKPSIMNGVRWAENLTKVFLNNKQHDRDLSWQFFCSNDGFLQLHPAAKWRMPQYLLKEDEEKPPLDLYDCRLRNWYIKAAASPKDIVVLLDRSGSMTGQRKEISRNVVINILETLTDDDFVTIIAFSTNLTRYVECFGDKLVQANKQNIQTFKKHLSDVDTYEIADFELAFTKGFELLEKTRREKRGAQCNQAIMLITDGAPESYDSLFDRLNRPFDEFGNPRIPARVFTYLVGKEVTDTQEVQSMACKNRGYYTHVANMAEVREQVQLYIPVMSRPLVLSKIRPFIYTGVYADITDVPLLEWVWDGRERERIRANIERVIRERYGLTDNDAEDKDKKSEISEKDYEETMDKQLNNESVSAPLTARYATDYNDPSVLIASNVPESNKKFQNDLSENPRKSKKKSVAVSDNSMVDYSSVSSEGVHDLMLTIAAPVFDLKNTTNITERYLYKNVWKEKIVEVRSANILGVAGVDVPIREIVRYTPAFKLGVNGYSFAINNNGHILYHPDLRPLFGDLIKPYYNSVNLSEIELDYFEAEKASSDNVSTLQTKMLRREKGCMKFSVKVHFDSMKRVTARTNHYCFGPIKDSPFTLGIALPEPYGKFRVKGQLDLKSLPANYSVYFRGTNWRVHPDWIYCLDNHETFIREISFTTPESAILFILDKIGSIQWLNSSLYPPKNQGQSLICAKDLLQSLVFDAKVTDIESQCARMNIYYSEEWLKTEGVVLSFVSTRSGFIRYFDHRSEEEKINKTTEEIFGGDIYKKATDELFYQRAVDFYRFNSSAFLFSVPFDAGNRDDAFVLASQALFFGSGSMLAPAAVVGSFFKHQAFHDNFFKFAKLCSKPKCDIDCTSSGIDCYLIDNNGFIVVSLDKNATGQFFGEVDIYLFKSIVEKNVFKEIEIFDYQAICINVTNDRDSNPAQTLQNPFVIVKNFLIWFWTQIVSLTFEFYLSSLQSVYANPNFHYNDYDNTEYEPNQDPLGEDEKGKRIAPNRTKPYPCDKHFILYEMQKSVKDDPIKGEYTKCGNCNETYIVQKVPYTNLMIVIARNSCECGPETAKIYPTEINYIGECAVEHQHMETERAPLNTTCVNSHPEESEIHMCGKGWALSSPYFPFFLSI
ncbi:voltage-dependent calcium channel subunit alpha-2/delta-3-like protein 2, partial [Dinothrombium tinctorium]